MFLLSKPRVLLSHPTRVTRAGTPASAELSNAFGVSRQLHRRDVIVFSNDDEGDREHFKTVESDGTYHPYPRRDEHFEIFLCRGLNQDLHTL